MAMLKEYNGTASKSYTRKSVAMIAVKKAQAKAGGECTYMVAHCDITDRFVPIILTSDNPVSYAQQGFRTFG